MVPRALVITPTTGSIELIDAIKSVRNQTVDVEHLIVCDGDVYREATEQVINKVGENLRTRVCYLPYNTGGNGFYSHRVIAGFSHLINHDYVLFLDQDNWFEPDHVESMLNTATKSRFNYDWVYSLRKVYDKEKNFLCDDNCESLGRWPVWVNDNEYLIDTSSYMYKREFFINVSHLWHFGWGADRRFYSILKNHFQHKNYGCTGKHTLGYRLGGNEGSVTGEFFIEGNKRMELKYNGKYPWLEIHS